MLRRSLTVAAAGLTLIAGVTACSSSKSSSGKTTPATSPSSQSAASTPATTPASTAAGSSSNAASTIFGPQCAALGMNNPALAQATQAPVGTVAAQVPFLSKVVQAANVAGLTATLNAAPAITVFAPVDDAFKKEPPAQVQALLTDPKMKPELIATLKYHVLEGRVAKDALVGKHATLEGADITITGSGDDYTVNGTAKILCGGIQTKNATVYLIDTVLHPAK
jgi:uncharacterized surface protein with fasciclin (FAS1) repeats